MGLKRRGILSEAVNTFAIILLDMILLTFLDFSNLKDRTESCPKIWPLGFECLAVGSERRGERSEAVNI